MLDYAREMPLHKKKQTAIMKLMQCTRLNSLYVIHEDDNEMRLDIHTKRMNIRKELNAIEHTIALAAIAKKEQELENAANSFDWSVGHVSHYYI